MGGKKVKKQNFVSFIGKQKGLLGEGVFNAWYPPPHPHPANALEVSVNSSLTILWIDLAPSVTSWKQLTLEKYFKN